MRQLFYEGPGLLTWHDVKQPKIQADHEVLVSTIAATTCDVDCAVIMGMSPFEPPFAIGHESVARVVDMGDAVTGLQVGDVVSVPYHRTCGVCVPCRNRTPLHCSQTGIHGVPSYGFPHAGEWGGMFSDQYRVPWGSHALVKIPPNVDPIAAVSMGDNLSDSWSTTVPHIEARPGAKVLVTGFVGGYGLYAVQWSKAAGASLITYIDHDPVRLQLAETLGAKSLMWEPRLKAPFEYDVIVNARPGVDILEFGLLAAAPDAYFSNMVIFFEKVPMPLASMHMSGVTFRSAFSATRNYMPQVAEALANGMINPRDVESGIIPLDDVPERLVTQIHKPIVLFE